MKISFQIKIQYFKKHSIFHKPSCHFRKWLKSTCNSYFMLCSQPFPTKRLRQRPRDNFARNVRLYYLLLQPKKSYLSEWQLSFYQIYLPKVLLQALLWIQILLKQCWREKFFSSQTHLILKKKCFLLRSYWGLQVQKLELCHSKTCRIIRESFILY